MPFFEVTRRKIDDNTVTAALNYEAVSADVARQEATQKGWIVTNVRQLNAKPDSCRRVTVRYLKGKVLIRFCRSVGSMLNAKISMSDAIRFYAEGEEDHAVKSAFAVILEKIKTGTDVADAFASSGRFDDMFVGLVRAGSAAGAVGDAFRSIAAHVETTQSFETRLRKALIMPTLAIVIVSGVFVFAQTTFLPQIAKTYADLKIEPDKFTAFALFVSRVTIVVWPFAAALVLAFVISLFFSGPRNKLSGLMMRHWTLFRKMIMGFRQLLILGTLEMLIKNGIPVVEAVKAAARVVSGTPMKDELNDVARRYQTGSIKLGEGISKLTSCDRAVAHLIRAGEETATLESQLELLATMYKELAGDAVDTFVSVATFLATITACLLIGFTFAGSMLPMTLMGPKLMEAGMGGK